MNLEQAVLDKLRTLPPDKQQQVLDFAEFLQQKINLKVESVAEVIYRRLSCLGRYIPKSSVEHFTALPDSTTPVHLQLPLISPIAANCKQSCG